ncbi:carbohydrate binding domain-containing protein [Paenibacillus flagellatus]|uniref:CBM-cenC domain-containing protein n=1 Tax=Paenibacillus flagellatus TaxID=2211139 RepID=A0A2V5JZ08_9BACL|nr:carbohydrate binding domain-containing protein [Paenibacillus flagellatus]PYI52155.1 hypothetical protein DLM86_22010 [Paenibacillus flagellatus]
MGKKSVSLGLALIVAMTCLPLSPALGADRSVDRFMEADQSFNFGLGSSDSPNGGSLAWSESYFLDGYMNMYEATGRTEWLDKVVDHGNRILANAVDHDGDGYKGWAEARYSHNQLKNDTFALVGSATGAAEAAQNGSFETDADADGLPDGWQRQGGPSATYRSVAAGDAYAGSAGLIVESDGANENRAVQSIAYTPSAYYVLEVFAGVETEKTQGIVDVFNTATNAVVASVRVHHVGFERYLLNFRAPSTGTLQVRLGLQDYAAAGYKARFDAVSIKTQAAAAPAELAPNRSFETASGGDATLPAGWTRAPGTTSADAYASTGINNYWAGTKAFAIASNGTSKTAQATIAYTPSQSYALSFWGRVSDDRYRGRLEVFNATDNVSLGTVDFNNTRWALKKMKFTAPAASGKTIVVRLHQADPAATFVSYFDLLSVKPVVQTEAAGWERASPLANAHMTNEPEANPNGEWGLELVHDGTSGSQISQYLLNYRPSSTYSFFITGKVSPGATGAIRAYDVTAGTTLGGTTFANSDVFKQTSFDFATPAAAGHQIRMDVYFAGGGAGDKLYSYDVLAGEKWEQQVHDALVGGALLRFAAAVYGDSGLHAGYLASADTFRNFVADHLVHKYDPYWRQMTGTDGSDNGTGVYVFPSGFVTEWFPGRSLPPNMYLSYARMLYLLYDATDGAAAYAADRPVYRSRANDMERAFKSKVVPHRLNAALGTDAYEWKYWDKLGSWDDGHYYTTEGEDLSHAGITVMGALEAYRRGQVFTASDMRKFARTFTDVMWNGSLTDPVLSYYNFREPIATADKDRANQFHHWVDLAEFDRTVWNVADALCKEELCSAYSASGVAKWSENKAVNAGFELVSPADGTLPLYWFRWQSTPATAYRDDTAPYAGDGSATVKTNGSTWQVLEQPLPGYEPNTAYTVTFKGKTNGIVGGRAQAYDYTTGTVLGSLLFSNTSWQPLSFSFTTPASSGNNVRIRLYHSSATTPNGIAYFDDVRVLPHLFDSRVPNGSFETADRFDPSLPRYWKRGTATAAAGAALDPSAFVSGGRSLKLSTVAGGAAQELVYDWKGYKPGAGYKLTVQGKTNGSAAGGRVKIVDTSTSAVIAETPVAATAWTGYTVTFTAPAAHDRTLRVVVTHDDPTASGGVLWIDDLGITFQ